RDEEVGEHPRPALTALGAVERASAVQVDDLGVGDERAEPRRAPESVGDESHGRSFRTSSARALLDPVPLALAPERRHVDAEAGGGVLQRGRLGEHLHDVVALDVLEGEAGLGRGGRGGGGAGQAGGGGLGGGGGGGGGRGG